ncbi:MAG: penicillin-binding protein 2 [Firmicutes bacterium]|nr:penicillin-binding protein 2 [Bacillota bacterium]
MSRIYKIKIVIFLALLALSGRIFYIAIPKGEHLAKQAVMQRTEKIPIKTMRGIIYDREMRAITEGQCNLHAAVVLQECADKTEAARLIGHPFTDDDIQVFALNAVTEQQAKLVKMKGVSLFNVSSRYNQNGMLSHVIGYTSDSGGFGIEQAFNDELTIQDSDSISMIKNANKKMMTGLGYNKVSKKTYKGIGLSIDYHIQAAAEKAMDKATESGAAIVVDVRTGDILAMVSRPNFNQTQLAKYLLSDEGEFINRAVTSYDAGSVFKVVLAAAALEEGYYTGKSVFSCTGSTDVYGKEFLCNELQGHGSISLEQGFALSCNSVFYSIGQKLGAENICKYAKKFGMSKPVLNIDGFWESGGNIPESANVWETANISIGQGAISVTPLQVADMFCTIANEGLRKQLVLMRGTVDEDGAFTETSVESPHRVLSKSTAKALQGMLKAVVESGTGSNAKLDNWGAAGKTGSAQTGWEKDGELMVHGWFGGFFPADLPQYVCVVLSQNGKSGALSAAPVFKEIGEEIMRLKY